MHLRNVLANRSDSEKYPNPSKDNHLGDSWEPNRCFGTPIAVNHGKGSGLSKNGEATLPGQITTLQQWTALRDTSMTTSSENKPSATPNLEGKHWDEYIATLDVEFTCELSEWLSEDLAELEAKLDRFTSPASIKKSLSR